MSAPLVLALVGTDHHPFDRMVDVVDSLAVAHPEVDFLVQHGATRPPAVARGTAFLPHLELRTLLAEAQVVLCHAGPGTLTDARAAGHVPVCLPRDPELGEHVDGHQLRFAHLVGASGSVRTVGGPEDARLAVEEGLLRPRPHAAAPLPEPEATVRARELLGLELDSLIAAGPARRRHRERPTRRPALLRKW